MDSAEEKARRKIYEFFEAQSTKDYGFFDTAYFVHKDHSMFAVIPEYDEEEFATFRNMDMTIMDMNAPLEPAELAAAALLASEISMTLGVEDIKSVEAALIKTCRPLLNMLHAMGLRKARIGLGVSAITYADHTPTPVMLKVLDLANVRSRVASMSIVWGWSIEDVERITFSRAGIGVTQIYPPKGKRS